MSLGRLENPMTFVRSLKGAPISVLFALMFTQRAMTSLELQNWTGYKDDNITLATKLLAELGWVVAISKRGPWALADQGRQLPLMPAFFSDSDLIGIKPTTTTIGIENRSVVETGSSSNVLTPPSPIKSESGRVNPHFAANLKACRAGGIGEPSASEISDMIDELGEPMTPDFITDHCQSLIEGETIGLAIIRIKGGEYPRNWIIPNRKDLE